MRLIDAGALLENFHKKRKPQEGADNTNQRHRYMQFLGDCEAIRNAPTIDAVPVIRCKDCKFFKPQFNEDGYYTTNCQFSKVAEVNGYCHMAKRKEE